MSRNCVICGKQFTPHHYGRLQEFCSDTCRQRSHRMSRKSASKVFVHAAENGTSETLKNKDNFEGVVTPIPSMRASWRQINEVTWKFEGRETAYVMQVAASGSAWVGRYEGKSVGPTTLPKAKEGIEKLIAGDPNQAFSRINDPIETLNRLAALFMRQ